MTLTDFKRLVELDGICSETPRDPYYLARFPVGCGKARPLRESLEFVLDDARAGVGAETCGERSGDREGEGKDVTTGFERVDLVMLASSVFSVGVRGRVEKVEVVEKERVLVVMGRRVAPADPRRAGEDESTRRELSANPSSWRGEPAPEMRERQTHDTSFRSVGCTRFSTTCPFSVAGSNSSPVNPRSTMSGDSRWISSGSGPCGMAARRDERRKGIRSEDEITALT